MLDTVTGGRRAADRIHGHGLILQHARHQRINHGLHHGLGIGDVLLVNDDVLDLILADCHRHRHRLADAEADALADVFAGLHGDLHFPTYAPGLVDAVLRRQEDGLAGEGSARNAIHIRALGLQYGRGQRIYSLASNTVRLGIPHGLHIGDAVLIERHGHGDVAAKAGLYRLIRPWLVCRFRTSACRKHAKNERPNQCSLDH